MSFCKFSKGYLTSGFTSVDNLFITHYMPFADEDYTKVYLYGLFLCYNMASTTLEDFSRESGIDIDTVTKAVDYWEEQGLITVTSRSPLEITYLPIKAGPVKKYKAEKYTDFNETLRSLYPDRDIPQGEYLRYYEFIDDTGIQQDALLMIIKYCINVKGLSVRFNYILTVAKDWVNSGIITVEDVDKRIKEYEANSETMRMIAKAVGKKSNIEFEDKQLYIKWTQSWGYDIESIMYACTIVKNKGGFNKLDSVLDNFYKLGIFTVDAMKAYKTEKDRMYNLALNITKRLGLYYESLDYIIETYISKWLNKGFDDDALLQIADISMKSNIRTYEGMNNRVNMFYKNGRITKQSIDEYVSELIETDNRIKAIIEILGSSRLVNNSDRDYYATWTGRWGFTHEVIMHVAKQCSYKSQSFAFLNNILGRYFEEKKFTIEDIGSVDKINETSPKKDFYNVDRQFTKEELGNLFIPEDLDNWDV